MNKAKSFRGTKDIIKNTNIHLRKSQKEKTREKEAETIFEKL